VDPMDDAVDGPEGRRLWARADQVLPGGGIYLSRSADFAGRGVLPGFVAEARGCVVVDPDGREYVDLLGANGPNILGYRHQEVEAAADRQRARLTSASMFPPALIELAEVLTDRFAFDWAVVSKNGSEVVGLGARVARQHTGRSRLIAFTRAYHGNDPELAVSPPRGPLTERTRDVDRLPWNDPDRLLDHAAAHGADVAAIVLNPLDQNPRMPTSPASQEFVAAVSAVQERHGVLVVFDDVRHGFRLHPDGSHHALGLRPDLLALGKALGNGHAVSALLGREELRRAARRILYTSTYMFEAPPMHAAMATIEVYDRDAVFDRITHAGERLRSGIIAAATAAGQPISYTGPVTMPTLLFEQDPEHVRLRQFASEAARAGALLHPALNWNLSAAHTPEAIDRTITIAEEAFAATPPPEHP
jgi:glutamate-1-semialdehyde 2,1-aminomutase